VKKMAGPSGLERNFWPGLANPPAFLLQFIRRKEAVKEEEWVELTDGKRKIIMPRREMVNLAQRISRVFA